ncbi:tetratricopeptide repeat protein [Pontibacter mangrovi]|uniref:Uncharacterized protein n=1 Tax=Pontibacter mangrovi TaxID=2589816 RepID=A0A501WBT3_9BACT|nr:hypothetical protein [Pontibacter mangrovi]TPE45850.1 hypothetical protein FJM65_00440 [Pontibacter mangrovi]
MRQWIAAAGLALTAGLSSCNMQNTLTRQPQTVRPRLTMQEVIPPMAPATKAQEDSQNKFLKDNVSRFRSRKLASQYYVLQAKRTFNQNQPDSAMIFLNRAWLMDRSNNEIYWGYGLAYGQMQEYDKALYLLYRTLDQDKENPRLLTDIATTHLARFYSQSNPTDLQQSRKLLKRALAQNPKNTADTYYKLAINSYYLLDFGQAWHYLHQSIKLDKSKENKKFIAALLQKEQDPAGVYSNRHTK